MRRYSIVLAVAAVLLCLAVGYTLRVRLARSARTHERPAHAIRPGYEGVAPIGWQYTKDDPQTNRPIVRVDADAFEGTHDPSTFELRGIRLRLYDKNAGSYTYVKSDRGLFDEGSGVLKSEGAVYIVMHVPSDKNAEDKKEAEKRVRVTTSGVTYETKTGKARTDQPASFVFTEGDGQAAGAEYDPNTRVLHLKSQIALDWIGKGPVQRKMHIETDDLVYKEAEGKVYLSPWAKMKRETTTIQAANTLVTLLEGRLHQIDGDRPYGADIRDDRHTDYSASKMVARFDEDGNLVEIVGDGNARVVSKQTAARTVLTGARADLHFALQTKMRAGEEVSDSELHLVTADGHSVAESTPLPHAGAQLPETRILRSEHIELEMKPGGQDVQAIVAPTQAQMEFKPNRPEQSHRIVDASHLRVFYGAGSYVDRLMAWNAVTHTDKAAGAAKPPLGPGGKPLPPSPALTWSDELVAKFTPNTNQVATVDQTGHFRYEEGVRKASASQAVLEQAINRITLTDKAHVLDDTGSAVADVIVMNQANGDMDARGHVLSTHEPNRSQKPGTSMLDDSQPMQAQADVMQTRDDNTKVRYQGRAVMWQGANRISADLILVDRDNQNLAASGNVISELVDNRDTSTSASSAAGAEGPSLPGPQANPSSAGAAPNTAESSGPIYTVVHAPELNYHDDTRIAVYSGGVKLVREKTTISAKTIQAYLTPKSEKASNESSLNHAIADGDVVITEVIAPDRTRVGTSQHCEYFTKLNKVVLTGGLPKMVDTRKGITKGEQLTYFSDEDHLIVDGKKNQGAFTQMKKR